MIYIRLESTCVFIKQFYQLRCKVSQVLPYTKKGIQVEKLLIREIESVLFYLSHSNVLNCIHKITCPNLHHNLTFKCYLYHKYERKTSIVFKFQQKTQQRIQHPIRALLSQMTVLNSCANFQLSLSINIDKRLNAEPMLIWLIFSKACYFI